MVVADVILLAGARLNWIMHYGREPRFNPNVKVILFNIFGGITRCDDVANGIVTATSQIDIGVPIVDAAPIVACGQGGLRLTRLQRQGKSAMDADAFLRGFALPVGGVL